MLCLTIGLAIGQEFPIENGAENCLALSASFDGTKYLVPIKVGNNAAAQFISTTGSLIGSRISIGSGVTSVAVYSAFDGTNFFLVWNSNDGILVGRLVSTNGALVSSQITIATNVLPFREITLAYNAGTYFVCYMKSPNEYLWGRRISTNGSLLGNEFQITQIQTSNASMAFDGSKYLIGYVGRTAGSMPNSLRVRFVSAADGLIGNEILVATTNLDRDHPTFMVFDGSRFLMAYHEINPSTNKWFLYGRFINTAGNLQNSITICDSSLEPIIPAPSFGNNNYLVTWTQHYSNTLIGRHMGQWYSTAGIPNGTPFVIYNAINNKVPFGTATYANNTFLVIVTRMEDGFINGDVYGRFISLPTGLSNAQQDDKIFISPNPATNTITLNSENFEIVELNIYSITGKLVFSKSNCEPNKQIGIGYLSPGVKIVEIKTGKGTDQQKLIIQR